MKTKIVKTEETAHKWYIIDVKDKVLGRAASKIAWLLNGKDQADYTPNVDNGAGVIILNCDKVRVTGRKADQKVYMRFSGYPDGQKIIPYKSMMEKDPKYVLRHAVKGMLPKNKLGMLMLRRLKLYTGTEHDHTAQKPEKKEI